MYDPATARFLSKDPLEERGGSPNLYLYCANDPVNKTDPSGQWVLIPNFFEAEKAAWSDLAKRAGVKIGFAGNSWDPYLRLDVSAAQSPEARAAIAAELRRLGVSGDKDQDLNALMEALYQGDQVGSKLVRLTGEGGKFPNRVEIKDILPPESSADTSKRLRAEKQQATTAAQPRDSLSKIESQFPNEKQNIQDIDLLFAGTPEQARAAWKRIGARSEASVRSFYSEMVQPGLIALEFAGYGLGVAGGGATVVFGGPVGWGLGGAEIVWSLDQMNAMLRSEPGKPRVRSDTAELFTVTSGELDPNASYRTHVERGDLGNAGVGVTLGFSNLGYTGVNTLRTYNRAILAEQATLNTASVDGILYEISGTGRLGGDIVDDVVINRLASRLAKNGVAIDRSPEAIKILETYRAGAGFDPALDGKTATLLLRPDATRYEIAHELKHYAEWLANPTAYVKRSLEYEKVKFLGRNYVMLARAKTTLAAERYVFNELKRTHFHRLTREEVEHAKNYIKTVEERYEFWMRNAK